MTPSYDNDGSLAVLGTDLFGNALQAPSKGPVAERFLFAPFSVLDARQGDWQNRKRSWAAMGMRSEEGRKSPVYNLGVSANKDNNWSKEDNLGSGTSIFDPVLCELAYRWFCPDGGQVVDPFAGGSVRGIVAGALGLRYWGCDLSQVQIEANRVQGRDIIPDSVVAPTTIPVKISEANARLEFQGCDPEYIRTTCHGRCCWVSGDDGKPTTTVHVEDDQQPAIVELGGTFDERGVMKARDDGKCRFQHQSPENEGLCHLHPMGLKPRSCFISPWMLTEKNTLIIRNRYKLLGCFKAEPRVPAYRAFASGLQMMFGDNLAASITAHFDNGGGDYMVDMPVERATLMRDVLSVWHDKAKAGPPTPAVEWVCGDSMDTLADAPAADFLFTCPPYGDLERYSDDPRDISTMEYHTFLANFKRIILRACAKLKQDRFACIVVGDFRDKAGHLRDFVSATIQAFTEQGLKLYNEAILVTAVGSAAMRVTKQFRAGRKLVKLHQNVLVFVKGDSRRAAAACRREDDDVETTEE